MRSELRRSLLSWPFWLSVFLCAAIYISPYWDSLGDILAGRMDSDYFKLFGYSHDLTFLWHAAPFLGCVPFAASFADETACGMHRMMIARQGRKRYFAKRMFAVWLSGYGVVCLGMLLAMAFWMMVGKAPMAQGYDFTFSYVSDFHWTPLVQGGHFIRGMVVACLYTGLYGGFWALMGLAITAYTPNRYVAVVAPFLIYFFSSLICTFIPQPYNEWHPVRLVSAAYLGYCLPFGWAWAAALAYYLLLDALMVGLFVLGIQRRDRHGSFA
ncbi:MAG: hypothetical protein ACOYJA_07570 [Christensenellales bacterium]|jgi:hypothetical protein